MAEMIRIRLIKCKTDNCYIISNGGKAVLVDTGSGEAYNKVLSECSKFDMQLVVLTHVHFDHAGNAAKLANHFNIPVALHQADVELFESFDNQPIKSYGIVGKVVLALSLKVLRYTKIEKPEKMIFIKEGDSLSKYGINAKIIELPGHTKGSIGVDVAGRALIAGDALDNWLFPSIGHLYTDYNALKESAEKIRRLGNRKLYYGHGVPTKNRFIMFK